MVRNTLKLTKFGGLAVAALALLAPAAIINDTNAQTCVVDSATGIRTCSECPTDPSTGVTTCSANGTFSVSVEEILTVTVTPPSEWAKGTSELLINKVGLSVMSNNALGFQASLTSKTNETSLVNQSDSSATIPTLAGASTKANFPAGYWGFATSSTDAEPDTYKAIVGVDSDSAPTILTGTWGTSTSPTTGPATGDTTIYFGAKAGSGTTSGTYERTVQISVVTKVDDDTTNPQPSDTPNTPNRPNPSDPGIEDTVIGSTNNSTSGNRYNYTTSTDTTDSETKKPSGNSSSYDGHAYPQGQLNTVSTINEGTPLATGLAITACVAAVFGIFFFIILFKRRKDEEEEEDQQY